MSFKTIFIVIVTALITVTLVKNADEVDFWFFGSTSVSKPAILGITFVLGLIVGIMVARPRKKPTIQEIPDDIENPAKSNPGLSDEDRNYIS